jgi:hypothetical protein
MVIVQGATVVLVLARHAVAEERDVLADVVVWAMSATVSTPAFGVEL